MTDDATLIDATRAGDSTAFGELVTRHQNRLYNTMVHLVGCAEDAEDVVQDAFVQAFVQLDKFRGAAAFYTWLYRIAFNTAMSHGRRRKPTRSVEEARAQSGTDPVDPGEAPDEQALQAERAGQIQAALTELSEDHRAVLVLREMDGCSYEEIAEILGLALGTVRSRLHRGRMQLRELPATFRDKVLQQAERAMLTRPVEAPAASQANAPRRPKWLRVGDYQTLAWPAAVLAVVIMLMVVYHKGLDKMREVAQVDIPQNGAAEGKSGGRRTPIEIRPRDADKSASETVEMLQLDEDLASDGLARENRPTAAKQPTGRPLIEASPAAPRTPTAAGALAPTRRITAKAEERVEPKSPTGSSGGQPGNAGLSGMQPTADRYADGSSPERGPEGAPTVDFLEAADLAANQSVSKQLGLGRGILLVQIDVSRRAAQADAFERLLERQQIVPQQQRFVPQQKLDESAPTARRRKLERSTDGTISHDNNAVGRDPVLTKPPDRDKAGRAPEDVEIFYVEATESQVQAALEDMQKRGDEFPAFAVQADPTQPRQARFGRYQRGRQSGVREELSAMKESRGSNGGHRIEQRAAQQVQEADGEYDNGRQGVQQPPAAAAPEGRLGHSQATPGRGGRGRSAATGEARPLQIVFLLRVVDPKPAPTADAVQNEPR